MNKNKILIPVISFTTIIIIVIIILNSNQKYNKISVSESKWNSIIESRVENRKLMLEYIKFNDYKLIIDETNNTVYYSVINDGVNRYNPTLTYSTNSKNVKLVIFSDEITNEKINGNHKFIIMIYNEKEYHIYNLKCTDLPILNINYNKYEEIKQKNIPMELYLFDNISNIANKVTISNGKFKTDGENYIFSLHMLTPGKNKRNNKISILNMKPSSEYILKPIKRDLISYEKQNNIVELFFNNKYIGVYSLGSINERIGDINSLQFTVD